MTPLAITLRLEIPPETLDELGRSIGEACGDMIGKALHRALLEAIPTLQNKPSAPATVSPPPSPSPSQAGLQPVAKPEPPTAPPARAAAAPSLKPPATPTSPQKASGLSSTAKKPAPAPDTRPVGKWTPERLAVLEKYFATSTPIRSIQDALNQLPGKPFSVDEVYAGAGKLGLKRPAIRRASPSPAPAEEFEVIDLSAALQWAEGQKLQISSEAPLADTQKLINHARAGMGLDPWKIVRSAKKLEPLPAANVGSNYAG